MTIAKYQNQTIHARATVDPVAMRPYYGAKKQVSYRLKVYDSDGIMYHLSVFDNLSDLHYSIKNNFGPGWQLITAE